MAVYARPDSRFWWYWLEGTEIRQSTKIPIGEGEQRKDSRRRADKIYHALMSGLADERHGLHVPRKPISFRVHAEWYRDHVTVHHRGGRRATSIIKALIAFFGDIPLSDLDTKRIEEWKAARALQVSKATVNRELDLLKPLLERAVPSHMKANPAHKVKRFPTRRFAPITVLSASAEAALLEVATPQERAFVLLGLDALMRLGDVRTFTTSQNHGTTIEIKNEKTLTPFRAPASTRLQAALVALPSYGGYYFAKRRNRGPLKGQWRAWSEAEAFEAFKSLCERAHVLRGRKAQGVTFHSLRHTGASRASRAAKPTAVMRLGGWNSLTQLARYDHPDDADLIRAVEAIGGSRPAHAEQPTTKKQRKKRRVA